MYTMNKDLCGKRVHCSNLMSYGQKHYTLQNYVTYLLGYVILTHQITMTFAT